MKTVVLAIALLVPRSTHAQAAPSVWAAGPQLRMAAGPLPALALGLFVSREMVTWGAVSFGIEADGVTRTIAATETVCASDPCRYTPRVAAVGDVVLRLRTRASDSGWRPSLSFAGGFYGARTDGRGVPNGLVVRDASGALVGVGIGVLPPADRGFSVEAIAYNYSNLYIGDALSFGLRAGWRW